LRLDLARIEQRVHDKHAEVIDAIEQNFNQITEKLAEVETEFSNWENEAAGLWESIASEIEERRPDLSDVDVSRSQAPGSTDRFVLFDSGRDYFTQMDAYNAWRDGDELDEAES
jgi:hypothetical protein